MKTEMQRQLEALGFNPLPKPKPKPKSKPKINKVKNEPLKKVHMQFPSVNSSKPKNVSRMTENEAKVIVRQSYRNSKSWSDPQFGAAIRCLTGQSTIMTQEMARRIVAQWHLMDSRFYRKDYSIAVLMLTGIWIPPKRQFKGGMSSQIKARCERRDINGSYKGAWVFKN